MKKNKKIIYYILLSLYGIYALYPIFTMIMTSLKSSMDIMKHPLSLPQKIYLDGYIQAWTKANFGRYFLNSLFVSAVSLLAVLALSILASYGLGRYTFKGNRIIYLYFLIGIMIPIKLGTINLFDMMNKLNLMDNLMSVIIVNIAMSISMSVFILTKFIQTLPKEMDEAACMDGCNSLQYLLYIVMPLTKPAIATIAIMNFLPIWNDFYFPLLFIKSEKLRTIPLGISQFFGEFETDWNMIFSGLSIASIPTIILYAFLSKQFIEGLTSGAVKE